MGPVNQWMPKFLKLTIFSSCTNSIFVAPSTPNLLDFWMQEMAGQRTGSADESIKRHFLENYQIKSFDFCDCDQTLHSYNLHLFYFRF